MKHLAFPKILSAMAGTWHAPTYRLLTHSFRAAADQSFALFDLHRRQPKDKIGAEWGSQRESSVGRGRPLGVAPSGVSVTPDPLSNCSARHTIFRQTPTPVSPSGGRRSPPG